MPIYALDVRLVFPPAELAAPDGLLAVGGDLSPERLLLAYRCGIFPWYHEGLPILWHSPDPRTVLPLDRLHVPRSLRRIVRKETYEIRLDTSFDDVIRACAAAPRPEQDGTWITAEMEEAYRELHRLGWAHSAEAWSGARLVGGLYGVSIGSVFFGESMFTTAPDASKAAFVVLCRQLERWGIDLVDCQVPTEHLERFGAVDWSRARYLRRLVSAVERPSRCGRWRLDADLGGGAIAATTSAVASGDEAPAGTVRPR